MSNKQSRTVSHNIIFTALSPKQGQQEQGPESSLRLTKKVEIKGMPSILKQKKDSKIERNTEA